jgi:hypothetical protein
VARAALKTYRDDDAGEDVAHLFLPAQDGRGDRVRVAVRIGSIGLNPSRFVSSAWEWDDARSGDLQVQGFGVPVVPFVNRLGLGEYEPHLDLLDRINNMIGDRLWVSKFQVFRQRALRIKEGGQPLPDVDPDTGEKIDYDDLFEADPGAMWELPAGVDIWESQQTDMTPILTSVRDDVREFSAVTRTPLSMFSPQGADTSAAGAENLSDGLVFKGEDRTARLTPSVARTMQLALAYAGEVELARRPLGVTWAPVRRTTLTERAQAATAGKASGVPQEAIYSELWQFTPEQVARMQRQRGSDLFFQAQAPGAGGEWRGPGCPGDERQRSSGDAGRLTWPSGCRRFGCSSAQRGFGPHRHHHPMHRAPAARRRTERRRCLSRRPPRRRSSSPTSPPKPPPAQRIQDTVLTQFIALLRALLTGRWYDEPDHRRSRPTVGRRSCGRARTSPATSPAPTSTSPSWRWTPHRPRVDPELPARLRAVDVRRGMGTASGAVPVRPLPGRG